MQLIPSIKLSPQQRNRGRLWRLLMALLLSCALLGLSPHVAIAAFDCNSVTEIPVTECQALVAFYNSTGGPNWSRQDGWLNTTSPCSWYGTYCELGTTPRHVVTFLMFSNGVVGAIPPEIGNLTHLKSLSLSTNRLSNLPAEIGRLSSLNDLTLTGNRLSSLPPEIGNLSSLGYLDVGHNQLSNLPPEIGNLSSLGYLDVGHNQLSNLPPEIGNLSNLQVLALYENPSLAGPLPSNLLRLNLTNFNFLSTKLCEPNDAAFQTWLGSIPHLRDSGLKCTGSNPPPSTSSPLRLSLFTTETVAGGVTLHWETETEGDNTGFNLYRISQEEGSTTKVNTTLIPAHGTAQSGATYDFVDRPASGNYTYVIKNVDQQGAEHLRGQVEAVAQGSLLFVPSLSAP